MKLKTHLSSFAKHQFIKTKIGILLEMLLIFLVAFIIIKVFVAPNNPEKLIWNQIFIWIANIIMLSMVVLGANFRGEGLKEFGLSISKFNRVQWLKFVFLSIAVFVFALIAFIIGSIIMANIIGIPEQADMASYDYMKGNLGLFLLSYMGVLVVSSFGEEVIYRAYLINRFQQL